MDEQLTEREKFIIQKAVEQALLELPNVLAALYEEKTARMKISAKWRDEHKEFEQHKDIVESVVEELDAKNPGRQYREILDMATPVIKQRISMLASLDMKKGQRPTDLQYQYHDSEQAKPDWGAL